MNKKEIKLYNLREAAFTETSLRKELRENAEFWIHMHALMERSDDEIKVCRYIYKDPFMGYCINVEIQCAYIGTKMAAEKIRSTYYYLVPLEVDPSIGETSDLFARLT